MLDAREIVSVPWNNGCFEAETIMKGSTGTKNGWRYEESAGLMRFNGPNYYNKYVIPDFRLDTFELRSDSFNYGAGMVFT